MKSLLLSMPLWLLAGLCAVAESLDSLRVYETHPARFEYVFMSVFRGADGKPIMAFNNRQGNTAFAGTGGTVGQFRISGLEAITSRVFDVTVNALQEKVSWHARLERRSEGGEGKARSGTDDVIHLEQGKPCPQPGWMAGVVSMESGSKWEVGENERLMLDGRSIDIVSISKTSVVVSANGARLTIPPIYEVEKMSFDKVREQVAFEKADQWSSGVTENDKPDAEPDKVAGPQVNVASGRRRIVEIRLPPRWFFGSEYYYPTEFQAVPAIRDSSGRVISPGILAPKRFQRASVGFSVQ